MVQANQAPTAQIASAGARVIIHYKDSEISASARQKTLFNLLSDGGRYTTRQMSKLAPVSSPTKEIHRFRNRGINVCDEWAEATKTIPRHKRYWIDLSECKKEVQDE